MLFCGQCVAARRVPDTRMTFITMGLMRAQSNCSFVCNYCNIISSFRTISMVQRWRVAFTFNLCKYLCILPVSPNSHIKKVKLKCHTFYFPNNSLGSFTHHNPNIRSLQWFIRYSRFLFIFRGLLRTIIASKKCSENYNFCTVFISFYGQLVL